MKAKLVLKSTKKNMIKNDKEPYVRFLYREKRGLNRKKYNKNIIPLTDLLIPRATIIYAQNRN